jgi:hypothetical protein
MGKASNEASKRAHQAIYDNINVALRKDAEYTKAFLLDHIKDYGYGSMNDFLNQAIVNQVKADLQK